MKTHSQIVRDAGRPDDVAAICGVTVFAVRSWAQRDRIPSWQWATFANRGWATFEELASTAAKVA